MNLKAKTYVQDQKAVAEQKLAARQAILSQNGIEATIIAKDVLIRKLQSDIRKARLRLKSIADQEKLVTGKAEAKARKLADALAEKKAGGQKKSKAAAEKKVEEKAPKKEKKAKEKKPAAPAEG